MAEAKSPWVVKEEPGTKYYCSCYKSEQLPYCDGAHKGTESEPYMVEIDEPKTVAVCSCGQSKNRPFCDGTHKSL
jgi:CDGSH-type Zn-finger protein